MTSSKTSRKLRAAGTHQMAPNAASTRLDLLTFFRAWTANPMQVASIIPSSHALSELITSEISPSTAPIIELGAGTGVFTRALLNRGLQERDLTLVEFGSDFAVTLQARFPDARVLWMDAGRLAQHRLYEGRPVGAVVSGLPLLTMVPRRIMAILGGAFAYLRQGGNFYQFTYAPRCPVPRIVLDRLGLKAIRIGGTLRNFPPASVYRISRRRPFLHD
jgi:phosphatidylethanolamine/phosphatidyl-N-methylethanolamine N-methyltransferase